MFSWNADESGKKYIVANTTGLQKALWEFYEVVSGRMDDRPNQV